MESFPNTILNQCNCLGGTVLGQIFFSILSVVFIMVSFFSAFVQHVSVVFQDFFGMFEINQLID